MVIKKKVFILSHAMEIGGAERALLGLLESFDYSKYEVDLFLMRHEGELFDRIPSKVNLLPEIKEYTGFAVPMVSLLKKRQFGVVCGRIRAKVKSKIFVKKHRIKSENAVELEYSHKYNVKHVPRINNKNYDLAISFLTPHYFAAEKVDAKKRIAWIHTDYSYLDVDVNSETTMWGRYDYIASISDDCTKGFCDKFPNLTDRIVPIENISSVNFIRQQAKAEIENEAFDSDSSIKLLSIGRFSHQKNFDNVPDICKRILKEGINIKWYLIGFGGEEDLIKQKISESDMQNNVIILGKTANPYPYIANCDLYVQPSRYEGKAVTVREAQILNKPVIITDYPTSSSQLANGFDGVIVPMDNEGCSEGIVRVVKDKELQQKLIQNTKKTNYSNSYEIEKLYQLI